MDGNVETFKARLVAKGFTQREGIDYEDTFSPVAMLKSICILLAINAHYDYEIWQMDIKMTFLNGYLEQDIYIRQPDGFIAEDCEDCSPKTDKEIKQIRRIPYDLAVGSLMYAMVCTRPNICYSIGIVSRYQSNPGLDHWSAVKNISKYLRRTKSLMLVYGGDDLVPVGYTDSDFQSDPDVKRSTSGYVFKLNGGVVSWKSVKQGCTADSAMETEYIATSEAAKEVVWLRNFLIELEVVEHIDRPMTLHCDNSAAITQTKDPKIS
ncbi:secreted RxLR effector protein 161-like [Cornus florida]|uniref:secreted RxLR effector protein 161-like n=1 Tax=Cornus florida TaxID=4283 RepID=UPI00289CB686|nr:secreted RxLR effector protein 161-like [Cornus florida]